MKRWSIVALMFFCAAAARRPIEKFSYAGYSLDTNLSELRAKLPNSEHDDQAASYYVWVSPKDLGADRLRYLNFILDKRGKIERVHLSFEVPLELRKKGIRGPKCAGIQASLVKQYGPVMEIEPPWYEEAALHKPKIWFDDTTELVWDCTEYAVVIQRRPPPQHRTGRVPAL